MKRVIFLYLVVSLIIGSCAQEKKSPIEGAWQLIYGQWQSYEGTFPAQIQGGQIKMWSKEYFAFIGQMKKDTLILDAFGSGTYTLNGNKYEENVIYYDSKPSIGITFRILLEIRNDTLFQKWPADENWKLAKKYSIEKYIRLK